MTSRIARTLFLTSIFAYAGFVYLDYLEPGVVSDVVSVHLWLLPIIVSGFAWSRISTTQPLNHSPLRFIPTILLGLAIGTILWHNGDMFGDFRLLLALCGAALPTLAIWTVSFAK